MSSDPSPRARDVEHTSFQEEAKRILVMEGGMNDRSQLKLQLLAQKYSLSPGEISAALNRVLEPDHHHSEQVGYFRIVAEARLEKEGMLTPPLRQRLEEIGKQRYGLSGVT